MSKSENIQKSDKAPKIIREDIFLDLMVSHLILFAIWMTARPYTVNLNHFILIIKLKLSVMIPDIFINIALD
ncbi:transposase IS982 [Rickettsia australis str. Cutlack]|uniref:Transposase IS982 n=1 Tax=Rickettsia australis (strain Cutlack) TaxID=1105110 RepID=H8K827_RICAC|nr:transposase IS982 [Rickettsia australis str. Cutlack]